MILADLHSHSLFSRCGVHSVLEMLTHAKQLGIKALAITDHGRALDSSINSVFYERLKSDVVPGIHLIKGIEANLTEEEGKTDIPRSFLPFIDLILLGIHFNIPTGLGKDHYTKLMLAAIENNPGIDIITHPDDPNYPLDFFKLASIAKEKGIAIELNNSKTMYKRTTPEITREVVCACKKHDCRMVVNSDAHTLDELGRNDDVLPFLAQEKFPNNLIVNLTVENALAFIEERREGKVKQQ